MIATYGDVPVNSDEKLWRHEVDGAEEDESVETPWSSRYHSVESFLEPTQERDASDGPGPSALHRDSRGNLPRLSEVWPYGTSTMFRDKWTPEMKKVTKAYMEEHTNPPSPGGARLPLQTRLSEGRAAP